jgi:hypothetical protein
MQTKFEIIETSEYILAVSDEEIEKDDYFYYTWFGVDIIQKVDSGSNLNNLNAKNPKDDFKKIITYKPKGNAPELDLPLLPEIVVEDDVEKLAEINSEKHHYAFGQQSEFYQLGFIEGYKAATKKYSGALDAMQEFVDRVDKGEVKSRKTYSKFKIILESLKQPKTPKWFVAETELKIIKHIPWNKKLKSNEEFEKGYPVTDFILKTMTIKDKIYLVGTYIKE